MNIYALVGIFTFVSFTIAFLCSFYIHRWVRARKARAELRTEYVLLEQSLARLESTVRFLQFALMVSSVLKKQQNNDRQR
jgi:phosphate/sulfate permease